MATIALPDLIANIQLDQRMAVGFLVAVVLAVAVRMYVRLRMTKQFGVQDWTMVATFLFAIGHFSASIANCSVSIRLVKGDLSLLHIYTGLYRTAGIAFVLSMIALKVSVGFFFLYIFSHHRFQTFFIYTVMVSTAIFGLVYLPLGNLTCAQFKKNTIHAPPCPDRIQTTASVFFVLFSVITIIGDFGYCIIGCAALWFARLPRLTKISAGFLLCLASMGGIACIVRLSIFLAPTDAAGTSREEMWLIRWILIEVAFSIIAANLAMTKPLFQVALIRLGLSSHTDSSGIISGVVRKSQAETAASAERGQSDADSIPLVKFREGELV